jgi:hypothetical protein
MPMWSPCGWRAERDRPRRPRLFLSAYPFHHLLLVLTCPSSLPRTTGGQRRHRRAGSCWEELAHGRSRGGRGRRFRPRPGTPSTRHRPPELRRRPPSTAGKRQPPLLSFPVRSLGEDDGVWPSEPLDVRVHVHVATSAHAQGPPAGPFLLFFFFSSPPGHPPGPAQHFTPAWPRTFPPM